MTKDYKEIIGDIGSCNKELYKLRVMLSLVVFSNRMRGYFNCAE